MSGYDSRQDKPYRRGLVLGMTMAEIMILLIFVLLMALATALAKREEQIAAIEDGVGDRLVEAIQAEYPEATTSDDYFKELVRAIEARRAIESVGEARARDQLMADADLGRRAREAAEDVGADDPVDFAQSAIDSARLGFDGEWPPFINLDEAGRNFFDPGKATLRPEFDQNLRTNVIPLLAEMIEEHRADVVEVIGHTDEVPMVGVSNLDQVLIAASTDRFPMDQVRSTDNAGLAMARAVAVVRILRADPNLSEVTILPLSGAQMIIPVDQVADGTANESDQRRRRIEIRLRRSTEQVSAGSRE